MLFAFALTETGVGSDVRSIKTSAEYIERKQGYLLNGSKIWVFNAPEAEAFIVFAKTVTPKFQENKDELTAFVVEKSFGVKVGKPEKISGLAGLEVAQIYFEDVFVPEENIIYEEGQGFLIAVETLNYGRLELASEALGIAKKAIKISGDYALHRKQFGNSIAEYGMIQEKIGKMSIDTYILESMIYLTAGLADTDNNDFSIEAAICKIFASESVMKIIDYSTSICSSVAFLQEHWLSQILKDLRMMFFFQGTNEVLRLFVAFSGLNNSDNAEEITLTQALTDPIKSLGIISDMLVKKLSATVLSNRILRVDPTLKREAEILENIIENFSHLIEKILKKFENEIIQQQFLIKRIADITIKIYAISAVISRVSDYILENGKENSIREIEIAIYVTDNYKKEITDLCKAIEKNKDEYLKDAAKKVYKYQKYKYDILND
jgi:acyl-CoA dehydrogenase family protein 9